MKYFGYVLISQKLLSQYKLPILNITVKITRFSWVNTYNLEACVIFDVALEGTVTLP